MLYDPTLRAHQTFRGLLTGDPQLHPRPRQLSAPFRARVEEAAKPPWLWAEAVRGAKRPRQASEAETRGDAGAWERETRPG